MNWFHSQKTQVIKITPPQVPSGLYEAPVADASSSGAQQKY